MKRAQGRRGRHTWTAILRAGLLGLTGIAGATLLHAQTTSTQVPDAPRPQALPDLNTITPTAPAVPDRSLPADPNAPRPGDAADSQLSSPQETAPSKDAPVVNGQPVEPGQQITVDEPGGPVADSSGIAHIRVQVNYHEIPFTVKDSKGRDVPGITYREVRLYENNQRIPKFQRFTSDPAALSVALVIDQSVTQDTMDKINTALGALQGAFTPYDEIAVFTYNNGVKKQDDFSMATGARLGVVLDRSKGSGREALMPLGGPLAQTTTKNNFNVDPNTAPVHGQMGIYDKAPREFHVLNDAMLEAAKTLAHAPKGRRRVIYIISDGKEYGSKAKQSEVIHYLQTNQIAVYATLVGDTALPGFGFLDRIHLPLQMRDDVLPRYTAATGGGLDPEFRPRGIEDSFTKLATQVRTQYLVGYYSHEPILDGKFRKIEVRVMRPNLSVIAEDGYYPNAQDAPHPTPRPAAAAASAPAQTVPAADHP